MAFQCRANYWADTNQIRAVRGPTQKRLRKKGFLAAQKTINESSIRQLVLVRTLPFTLQQKRKRENNMWSPINTYSQVGKLMQSTQKPRAAGYWKENEKKKEKKTEICFVCCFEAVCLCCVVADRPTDSQLNKVRQDARARTSNVVSVNIHAPWESSIKRESGAETIGKWTSHEFCCERNLSAAAAAMDKSQKMSDTCRKSGNAFFFFFFFFFFFYDCRIDVPTAKTTPAAPVETSTTKTQRQDLLHAQRCNLGVRFFFSPGQSHSFPPLSRITRTPSASRRPQRSRNEIPKVVKHDKQLSRPGAGLIIIGCEFERISRIGRRRSFARSLCLVSADKSRFARQLENTIAAATSILHFHLLLTLLLLLLQRSLFSPIASPYSLLFRGKQQSTHTHTHLVCVVRDKQEQQQQQQQPLMFPNHQTGHSPLCIDSRLPAALWLAYTNKTGARNKDVVL